MTGQRRILSIWLPHLAAERVLRRNRGRALPPLAVVAEAGNALTLASICPRAMREGLQPGMPLSDARALCPELVTAPANPLAESGFLTRLRRWAGRFSPRVAEEAPDALLLDITGCAHLFGGEEALARRIGDELALLGLSARTGIADTPGAAWALARFAGQQASAHRSGDAVEQEARATRSRAFRRRGWERGGPPPAVTGPEAPPAAIAPPGQTRAAIAPLPLAALRLDAGTVANLNRLGLRLIADLAALPRAGLARRFGQPVLTRLDQALGALPEPISPAHRELHFATRLTLPDPIGLPEDIAAAVDRLLPPLCARLRAAGRGARQLRLTCMRSDRGWQVLEVGLARPGHDPERIRALIALRLPEIEPGFGIDVIRLEAHVTEPLAPVQHSGHAAAAETARAARDGADALADLLGRLGARIGLDRLIRLHPAESHIPEKTATRMSAAHAPPAEDWPAAPPSGPPRRPVLLFPPEPVRAEAQGSPPRRFRWRRRHFETISATGPERIAPEWWLDDPAWRSGTRDYWRVETREGERLWLFRTRSANGPWEWFCHGDFG